MLKTRIITALFLVPLFLALIFRASLSWFGLVFAVLMLIGSWEFRRLAGMTTGVFGWLMVVIQAVILVALFLNTDGMLAHATALLTAACLVWMLMFIRLLLFRPEAAIDFQYRIISFACSLAVLSFGWIALYTLRAQAQGWWWMLVLLLIIWAADTGAYFSGKAFGKRKLAPRISPSKTIAGFVGGMLAAVIVSTASVHFIADINATALQLIPLTLITVLVSVGGDLFISLHKRKTAYKDSGRIFPGHGGVLDRFDSLLAGAPFFVLGKLLLDF